MYTAVLGAQYCNIIQVSIFYYYILFLTLLLYLFFLFFYYSCNYILVHILCFLPYYILLHVPGYKCTPEYTRPVPRYYMKCIHTYMYVYCCVCKCGHTYMYYTCISCIVHEGHMSHVCTYMTCMYVYMNVLVLVLGVVLVLYRPLMLQIIVSNGRTRGTPFLAWHLSNH